MKIIINDKCSGCGVCRKACVYNAIELIDARAVITANCTLCGACVSSCKLEAIEIEDVGKRPKKETAKQCEGVWVYLEPAEHSLAQVSLELLSKGRELADALNTKLTGVVLGANAKGMAEEALNYGPDEVILAAKTVFADKDEDNYAAALEVLVKKHHPEILLAGATAFGRSLAPKLAARLQTGLTADCTDLDIDKKKRLLKQTRPAFGGNIMATIVCEEGRPQMATVRPHVFKAVKVKKVKGVIVWERMAGLELTSRFDHIKLTKIMGDVAKITDAQIIVSGGRGLKKKENFKLIEDLAKALGGAVGASRAAVDSGWIEYPHQVGQTGKTVAPKVYIACGISGAIQHLAGMQTSDCIIAINKDPNAPIFDVAHYGVVGDVFEVIPELIRELKSTEG